MAKNVKKDYVNCSVKYKKGMQKRVLQKGQRLQTVKHNTKGCKKLFYS